MSALPTLSKQSLGKAESRITTATNGCGKHEKEIKTHGTTVSESNRHQEPKFLHSLRLLVERLRKWRISVKEKQKQRVEERATELVSKQFAGV